MIKIMWLVIGGSLASAMTAAPKDVVAGSSDAPKFQASDAAPKAQAATPTAPPAPATPASPPAPATPAAGDSKQTDPQATAVAPNPAEQTAYMQAPNFRHEQPEPEVSYSNGMTTAKAKGTGYSGVPHADPRSGRYIPPPGYDDYDGPAYDYDGKGSDPAAALKSFPQYKYTPTSNCKVGSLAKGSDRTLSQLWPGKTELPKNYDCGINKYKASKPDSFTCMVCNIYFEAGNEPEEGKIEVGRTTLTRIFNKRWPDSVCKVVYQGNGKVAQFSWTYEHKDHRMTDTDKLKKVMDAARHAMEIGPNCKSNYWSPDGMIPKGRSPDWAGQCNPKSTAGIQIFCPIGDVTPNRTVAEIAAGEGRQPSSFGSGGSGDPAGAR